MIEILLTSVTIIVLMGVAIVQALTPRKKPAMIVWDSLYGKGRPWTSHIAYKPGSYVGRTDNDRYRFDALAHTPYSSLYPEKELREAIDRIAPEGQLANMSNEEILEKYPLMKGGFSTDEVTQAVKDAIIFGRVGLQFDGDTVKNMSQSDIDDVFKNEPNIERVLPDHQNLDDSEMLFPGEILQKYLNELPEKTIKALESRIKNAHNLGEKYPHNLDHPEGTFLPVSGGSTEIVKFVLDSEYQHPITKAISEAEAQSTRHPRSLRRLKTPLRTHRSRSQR